MVWLYLRFTLSCRDIEDLLVGQRLDMSHETIRRWMLKFGPLLAGQLRRTRPRPTSEWHLDEILVQIAGKKQLLWRAVDSEGEIRALLVQRRRDKVAAATPFASSSEQGYAPLSVTDKLRHRPRVSCRPMPPSQTPSIPSATLSPENLEGLPIGGHRELVRRDGGLCMTRYATLVSATAPGQGDDTRGGW